MADPKPYVLRRYDRGAYTVHDCTTDESACADVLRTCGLGTVVVPVR